MTDLIVAELDAFKSRHKVLHTNLYTFDLCKWSSEVRLKNPQFYYTVGGIAITIEAVKFLRVYYWLAESAKVFDISPGIKIPLVVEFIENATSSLKTYFESQGFYTRRLLRRMVLNHRSKSYKTHPDVYLACNDDLTAIHKMYQNNFDILVDRIPDDVELRSLIQTGSVLCIREMGVPTAFANITICDGTSTLNHIFVNDRCRGLGYGRALLETFLIRAKNSKFVRLWVADDNDGAINLYNSTGFIFEKINNRVMVK
jgi:GNAT superfamily N-acetyltransferase